MPKAAGLTRGEIDCIELVFVCYLAVLGFDVQMFGSCADWVSEGKARIETRLVLPELGLVTGVQMLEGQLSQTSYVQLTSGSPGAVERPTPRLSRLDRGSR